MEPLCVLLHAPWNDATASAPPGTALEHRVKRHVRDVVGLHHPEPSACFRQLRDGFAKCVIHYHESSQERPFVRLASMRPQHCLRASLAGVSRSLAITAGLKVDVLWQTIRPYPTKAEVWKRVADAYSRARLTPRVRRLFDTYFGWRRSDALKT
jgi:hypothetical protein